MSVDLTMTGNTLDTEQWISLYDRWGEQGDDELFHPVQLGEEEGLTHFFISGPGSTRGFYVILGGDDVQIRLPAMASLGDWRRCYGVLRHAVDSGGGSVLTEEGASYSAEDLSIERADADGQPSIAFSLAAFGQQLAKSDETAHLPTPFFKLAVSAQDLALGQDHLMARLAEDFARFAQAFRPSMKLGGGERGEGAAWGLIPSIFPKLDWLMIPSESGDDMLVLPWSELERVLGARFERVGEDAFFVPGEEDMGAEVVARLREAASSPAMSSSTASSMAAEAAQDPADNEQAMRSILILAPLAVTLVVAGSDGKVEKKELETALAFMTNVASSDRPDAVRQIFAGCLAQRGTILEQLSGDTIPTVLGSLPVAMKALLEMEERSALVDALVALMKATAGATGGFLGFGSKVSAEEKKAIAAVESRLRGSASSA